MRRIRLPRYVVPASVVGSAVGLIVIIKDYCRGAKYTGDVRIPGKTVIITGANTGIGKETATELAKRGAKVIMACRNISKAEKTKEEIVEASFNRNIHIKQLDLASLESVREFAEDINKNEKRVDILINNAGVMRCPKSYTREGFEMQLGVNHLGHFLLTNLLLDKIKQSSPSRIIVLSSIAHTGGHINFDDLNSAKEYDPAEAYQQSKLANILFTLELSRRLRGTQVTVCAVHPGVVKTEIGRHMSLFKSFLSSSLLSPIMWLVMKTPQEGAQTVIHCALDPEVEKKSGRYFSDCKVKEVAPQAQDRDTAARLWSISEKWTRLS